MCSLLLLLQWITNVYHLETSLQQSLDQIISAYLDMKWRGLINNHLKFTQVMAILYYPSHSNLNRSVWLCVRERKNRKSEIGDHQSNQNCAHWREVLWNSVTKFSRCQLINANKMTKLTLKSSERNEEILLSGTWEKACHKAEVQWILYELTGHCYHNHHLLNLATPPALSSYHLIMDKVFIIWKLHRSSRAGL